MATNKHTPQVVDESLIEISEIEVNDIAIDRYTEFLVTSNERAIPDARDGLKPVHRRILLAFRDLHASATSKHWKSAKISGDTVANYHPHGDMAVYDAATKLAQDFATRYPLIDLPGNAGSIDGDKPASSRYTEMRPTPVGDEMLRDLYDRKANIVDWSGNYTNDRDEPIFLPGRFPQLLCNGILTGVGTGYSAMHLPHNLREVIDAIFAVMDDPNIEPAKIGKYIKGPDFPTGGIVVGTEGFAGALDHGKGTVTLRAKIGIEEDGRETNIVITEIPWQTEKTAIVDWVKTAAVKDKNGVTPIEGITAVEDQTGGDWRTEMRVVISLRRDANPQWIAQQLFRGIKVGSTKLQSPLQKTFSYNLMAYAPTEQGLYPVLFNLKGLIAAYIDHQMDVLTRRTQHLRSVALDALEVQEAYLLADKHANELVPMARKSANRADLETKLPGLIKGITKRQGEVIAGFPLYRFSKINTSEVKDKISELKAEIAEYDRLLKTKAAMAEQLKIELKEIRAKYGDDRRTEILGAAPEQVRSVAELVPDEACFIAVSSAGLIARLSDKTFKAVKRGAVGSAGGSDDPFVDVIGTRTREKVWILTDNGNVYSTLAAEIEEVAKGGRGMNPARLFSIGAGERAVKVIHPPAELGDGEQLIIATRDGRVARNKLSDYANLNAAGLKAIKLVGDDQIVSAHVARDGMHLISVTSNGFGLRFPIETVSVQGRGAQGVASQGLTPGARVVSLSPIEANDKRDLALVLSNGKGKRSKLSDFPTKGRATKGQVAADMGTASKKGAAEVVFAAPVADDDTVIFVTTTGRVLPMQAKEMKRQGRATAGVQTVGLSSSAKNPESVAGGAVAAA